MRFCKTCKRWVDRLRNCSMKGHDIDWDILKNQSELNYRCEYCGERYYKLVELQDHKRFCKEKSR